MSYSNTPRNAEQRSITVSKFRKLEKNTLRGFFTATLPSGLIINDLTYHVKGDSGGRWVGMPAREWKDKETGETKYMPIIEFATKEAAYLFCDLCLAALDNYFKSQEGKTK